MNLLPYFQIILDFLMDDYLSGLWLAGIGFSCIFCVLRLVTRKKAFHV